MADSLQILRNLQQPIPRYPAALEEYGPTDQELLDLQEQATTVTPGGYQSIPSRESVKDSAMQALRRALGLSAIQQSMAERRAILPRQIEGEYRLAGELAKARAMEGLTRAREQGSMERVQAQQAGARERVRLQQRGAAQRTGLLQRMMGLRQKELERTKQAAAVRLGKPGALTGVHSKGMRSWLDRFIGPSQEAIEARARELEQGPGPQVDYDSLLRFAEESQQQGLGLDEVLAQLPEQPSQEEEDYLRQLWGQ